MTKTCNKCGATKPLSGFYKNKHNADGLHSYCKECLKAYQALRQRTKRYGISIEEYEAMLEAQGGVCAICEEPESLVVYGRVRGLGVDHDHRCCSGQKTCGNCNRGLLCQRCNAGIGNLGDSAEWLEKAVTYLRDYEEAA